LPFSFQPNLCKGREHGKFVAEFDPDQTIAGDVCSVCKRRDVNLFHVSEIDRVSTAARTIIELNIKHYRELLKSEIDPAKRRAIAQLLREEEAKLLATRDDGK